jgi:methylmalonyl-CoA mutase
MNKEKLISHFQPATKNDWIAEAELALKGKPVGSLTSKTSDGIEILPIYFKENFSYDSILNDSPGHSPFKRGISQSTYREEPWNICQIINVFEPSEFNRIAKHEVARGTTSIALKALNPGLEFSNKQCGTFITGVDSIEQSLSGINLNEISLYFSFNSSTIYAFESLVEYLIKSYNDFNSIKLFTDFDYHSELLLFGQAYISCSDYSVFLNRILNRINTNNGIKLLGVNSYIYRNMGANTVQELAFSISAAIDTINTLNEVYEINEVISGFHFNMSVSNDFFMEIAKFRAARVIWSKLIESIGGKQESSKMTIRAVSLISNKSKLDKHTNMLRETTETLSGVIGGCQTISMLPFDNPHFSSDDFARRVARNTQLVIANECNLLEIQDPAGGSWYIETLTDELIEKAWALIETIENEGGFLKCIETGIIQNLIKESSDKKKVSLSTRKEILIGVNKYPNSKDILEDNNEKEYLASANQYRLSLDNLHSLDEPKNVTKIEPIDFFDWSDPFIELRNKSEKIKADTGRLPSVFLTGFGTVKQYKTRMDFSKEFLAVGGIDFDSAEGLNTIDETIIAFEKSGLKVAVICSTDDTYPEIVPAFVTGLRRNNPDAFIVLAGYPTDMVESYKNHGVDEFIHIKADIYKVLSRLLYQLEIRG